MLNQQRWNRRRFLQASGRSLAIGCGAAVPHCLVGAANADSKSDDRVLVVIQLSGGNDGLNTIVPYSDDRYRAARPNLALKEASILKIDDRFGLHPSLTGMRGLLDEGLFAAVHGVGYENPNRSHFESMDIWHTCSRKDLRSGRGWLGRFLDEQPSVSSHGGDVPAMHLGHDQQPLALTSRNVRVPTVQRLEEFQLRGSDPDSFRKLIQQDSVSESRTNDDLLGFVQSNTVEAIDASKRVQQAVSGYTSDIRYPENALAEKLRLVAKLIDSGMKTKIYYVGLDGFDTHAAQPETHSILLRQWSESTTAFVNDLKSHGHCDRVCVMTFSEFGRRVAENASDGTDHGAAGPVFICGGGIRPGLIGTHPDLGNLHQGDLKHTIDFRSVYAAVIENWMGASSESILGGVYHPIKIFA